MKIFETDRLILRYQTVEDAAFLLELWNDPSWIQNIGDRGVRTLEDARTSIQKGALEMYAKWGYGFYVTELKEGGIPLGICGFAKRDFLEDPDVGFAFLPRYWGKGYAYEAASAVMEYGRSVLGFTRIAAFTSPENEASGKLLEKLGLQFEKLIPYPGSEEMVRLYAVDEDKGIIPRGGITINNRVETAFETSKDNYLQALEQPWAHLFYQLLQAQLTPHLPTRASILDIGCGFGVLDRYLARQGHRVHGVDLTPGLLDTAKEEAGKDGLDITYSVLDLEAADATEAVGTVFSEPFDVTVLHNVLEYTQGPAAIVRKVAAWTKPGGLFSLVLHNPVGKVLNAAILYQDPSAAVEALTNKPHYIESTQTYANNYTVEQVRQWLDDAGYDLIAHYGVRTVYDWMPNDNKQDPDWHQQAFEMEMKLCDKEPYRSIAKFTHLIARKK